MLHRIGVARAALPAPDVGVVGQQFRKRPVDHQTQAIAVSLLRAENSGIPVGVLGERIVLVDVLVLRIGSKRLRHRSLESRIRDRNVSCPRLRGIDVVV